jgi:hypothetical protein
MVRRPTNRCASRAFPHHLTALNVIPTGDNQPPRGLGSRSTELPLKNAHRCFIGKPRKPCCGREIKAALVVLTGRHSQQQIACLPVVPIGKLAQKRNVVVCHLSVRRVGVSGLRTAADQKGAPATCIRVVFAPARKESFAMDRAKANVNPPMPTPQIT